MAIIPTPTLIAAWPNPSAIVATPPNKALPAAFTTSPPLAKASPMAKPISPNPFTAPLVIIAEASALKSFRANIN
jgi:hypothetical protein